MKRFLLVVGLLVPMISAQDAQHAYDGHVVERIQSVTITAKAGAPFRATVVTDWTRTLADGTRVTIKNRRTVARDSTGRVFQERRNFAADGDVNPTQVSQLEYFDPVRKELTTCVPMRKLCTIQAWSLPESTVETCKPVTQPQITITCETLGTSQTNHIETVGSRQIMSVIGGPLGLKQPEPTIKEFWFSPRLDVNLIVKRFEPRGGAQNFILQDISLNEPDPQLFIVPTDYRTARTVIQ